MVEITLPHNWSPRPYQLPAFLYLDRGGLHAELIWHRRAGKDDVCLHTTARAAHKRIGNYWHMLPLANQSRKAIWDAVNVHTGKRRIDEAFPVELRASTRDNDMLIKFKNGSTWQVIGSDNFQSAIGSSPAGIVYSEWAQSNPAARSYLRPILAENKGWQICISTPRGKNHAYRTFNSAKKDKDAFAQLLNATHTGVFTPAQLEREKAAMIAEHGEDVGSALYEQEYMCSWDAAVMGAYYGAEFAKIDREGRICAVPHDPEYPVFTAWDIGYDDDTFIWFYQIVGGELHIIESYCNSMKDPDHYASQISGYDVHLDLFSEEVRCRVGEPIDGLEHRRAYRYEKHWLPHDARAKTLAAKGKSIVQQLAAAFGWKMLGIVPHLSEVDGIQAARQTLKRAYFDTSVDTEGLRQFRREWDQDKEMFSDKPVQNWTNHPADAWRYLSLVWRNEVAKATPSAPKIFAINSPSTMTLNDLWAERDRKLKRYSRI
jgi:hypothetical protein